MELKRAYAEDLKEFQFLVDLNAVKGPEAFYQGRRYANVIAHFEAIPLANGSLVLDLGCGPGYVWRRRMSEHGQRVEKSLSVVGVDLSRLNLGAFGAFGVPVRADADALPFANAVFDAAVCVDVVEHLQSPCAMMAELRRVLKDGGHLLVSTPSAQGVYEHKAVFNLGRRPSKDQLKDLMSARWVRGVPSPSFPHHVKLYKFSQLRKLVEREGFSFVSGASVGFALPGFGLIARLAGFYESEAARRLLMCLERMAPVLCWNMVMVLRAR